MAIEIPDTHTALNIKIPIPWDMFPLSPADVDQLVSFAADAVRRGVRDLPEPSRLP